MARVSRFIPQKTPLGAAELNKVVDGINAFLGMTVTGGRLLVSGDRAVLEIQTSEQQIQAALNLPFGVRTASGLQVRVTRGTVNGIVATNLTPTVPNGTSGIWVVATVGEVFGEPEYGELQSVAIGVFVDDPPQTFDSPKFKLATVTALEGQITNVTTEAIGNLQLIRWFQNYLWIPTTAI